MQFAVTFRHMEPTEALKSYARERMERVRKYLPDPISCHVVLSTERHNHRIDVTFQLHNGLAVAGSRDHREHVQLDRPVHRQDRAPGPQVQGQARGHAAPGRTTCRRCRGRTRSSSEAFEPRAERPDQRRAPRSTTTPVRRPSSRSSRPRSSTPSRCRSRSAIVQLNLMHEPFLVFRPRHRRPRRGGLQARGRQLRPDRDAATGRRCVSRSARRLPCRVHAWSRSGTFVATDEDRRPHQARHGRARAARRPTSAASSRSSPRTWPGATRGSIARRCRAC